jgi:hypothetical protein
MIVDKPWGKVVTYALNQPASVRVITVEPDQETSVHYHQMRDEIEVRGLPPDDGAETDDRVVRAGRGERARRERQLERARDPRDVEIVPIDVVRAQAVHRPREQLRGDDLVEAGGHDREAPSAPPIVAAEGPHGAPSAVGASR